MSALRKMEMYETIGYEATPLKKSTGWLPMVIQTAHGTAAYEPATPVIAEVTSESTAKNIALFLAAPFIGLVYLLAMPFVAFGALAWMGAKAVVDKYPATKAIPLVIAAPFIGLAYVVAMPFVGIGALVWFGARSLAVR